MMADKPFRPMLACDASLEDYERLLQQQRPRPLLASYKMDGIRCCIHGNTPMSRTMKRIPNDHICRVFQTFRDVLHGLDGELIVGEPCGEGVYSRTSSGVMSQGGIPDFRYYVFDNFDPLWQFCQRTQAVKSLVEEWDRPLFEEQMRLVLRYAAQQEIYNVADLLRVEAEALELGFEGLIVRRSDAPYKQGRSTLKEGYMLKLKRFCDSEARIVGFQELLHNTNEAKEDERGYTKRSAHKAGKIAGGTLGALLVQDLSRPEWEFSIGTGFDYALRQQIWDAQDTYQGRIVKYRYLPIGVKDLPRHPSFVGFRHVDDL